MDNETYLDVELVTDSGLYSDTVSYKVVKLMMKADIVTIRSTSVDVREIEITETGTVRFHGNIRNL